MFAFFKKRKKNEKVVVEKIKVSCPCGNEKIEVDTSTVIGIPVGYKGRYDFYVECPCCTKKIKLDEESLPKGFIKEFYAKNVWN